VSMQVGRGGGGGALGHGLALGHAEDGEQVVVAGGAQSLLTAEVVGDERWGDPGSRRDGSQCRASEPALGELLERRVADPRPCGEVALY